MKKILAMLVVLALAGFVAGCATPYPQGLFYTEVKLPSSTTSNVGSSKVGVAECESILGLVATGDASIQTAARNGGITKIHHVDWEAKNILGIIGKYKTIVYGE